MRLRVEKHFTSRRELWWVAALMLLGLLPRLLMLQASDFGIESDEAIVGLMAKHITEGKPWPVFYYGQDYMGSLEALLAGLLFLLLGRSNIALKLVPLLFSLIHICLVYVLARRFVRPAAARIAALLTALGPSTLILWSHKARGGFIELVVLGTIALIMSIDILRSSRPSSLRVFLLGAVLGLGWWVNNQMIFYLLPIGAVFLFAFVQRFGFRGSVGYGLWCLFGFVAGGAPFWYANLFGEPRFATFRVLFGSTSEGKLLEYLQGFFTTALPIVFGARRFWSQTDVYSYGSLVLFAAYLLVFVAALAVPKRYRSSDGAVERGGRYPLLLMLLFCLGVPLIFSSSSFGWLSMAPRYLLPLYSVLFVLVAIAVEKLWDLERWFPRMLAVVLPGVLLGSHLASCYLGGIAIAGQPFVYRAERVAHSHDQLYRWLTEQGYTHIHTNYWIGYRTAFETGEQITFTRFGHPRSLRLPEYELNARKKQLPVVYVLVPAEAAVVAGDLSAFGFRFRQTRVGEYIVFDQVEPRWPRGSELSIEADQITASSRTEQLGNLIDGDSSSRWGSGMPQKPGMRVEVRLEEPATLSGIDIDYGPFVHDAPRNLEIVGTRPDGSTVQLFSLQNTKLFFDLQGEATSEVDPVWNIFFQPVELSKVSFLQHGSTTVFDWSMAEVRLYRAPGSKMPLVANGLSSADLTPESNRQPVVGLQ